MRRISLFSFASVGTVLLTTLLLTAFSLYGVTATAGAATTPHAATLPTVTGVGSCVPGEPGLGTVTVTYADFPDGTLSVVHTIDFPYSTRSEVLTKAFPKVLVKRYAFDLELLVLAHHYGFSIAEAPVVVNYRGKFGHIGMRTVFKIWWDTMAVFYRLNLKRYYDSAGAQGGAME